MAQYFHVTSLEELQKLCPNLQFENIDGIPCVIQDDQITDAQGQQVITAIDQNKIQISQPSVTLPQAIQNQNIIQQSTGYVFQQIDANQCGTETTEYIQQSQELESNEVEDHIKFSKPLEGDFGNNSNHIEKSVKECLVNVENNKQFITQVQPVIQQSIQIHQQIQAVNVGRNILVLQNQEQKPHMGSSKISSVQNQQGPHIVLQRQQSPKSQSNSTQLQQLIHTNDNSAQQFIQKIQTLPVENQQLLNQSDSQILKQLQYCNQVTVIDGLSPPKVTVECQTGDNLNQKQTTSQKQQQHIQYKQLVIPQSFEITSSQPLTSRLPQFRKKTIQQEIESSPVFILQKLDNPLVIRQPQNKIRLQNPHLGDIKANESFGQAIPTNLERISRNVVTQVNEESFEEKPKVTQVLVEETFLGVQSSDIEFNAEKTNSIPIAVEIIEPQSLLMNRSINNINKVNVLSPASIRTAPVAGLKTIEQQTEPAISSSSKDAVSKEMEKFRNDAQCQTPSSHIQVQLQSSNQTVNNRGRGTRGAVQISGIRQCRPRGRGAQAQTSPTQFSTEHVISRGPRLARGGSRGGRGSWNSPASNQRQTLIRPEVPQIVQAVVQSDGTQTLKSNVEEAKMLVLLLNGEKKLIKIPSSQPNFFLGQILQQAGLNISTPTAITVEQVVNINDSTQSISSSSALVNQQASPILKTSSISQSKSTSTQNETTSIVATIQQHCNQSPRNQQITVPKHNFESPTAKQATSTSVQTGVSSLNAAVANSHSQSHNIEASPQTTKEEPRFMSGLMAICPYCGIQSLDFNKCIRCRRKLPENVKAKPIFSDVRIKTEQKATAEKKKVIDGVKIDSDEKQSDSSGAESKEKTFFRISDRRKIKPCVKKKKITEEPTEILILSSDDEEEAKTKKTELNKRSLAVLRKEPAYIPMELTEKDMNNIIKESSLHEELMKNVQPGLFTTLLCRTIRVGSYKVQPKERVLISNKGIRLVIYSLKNENTVIVIPITDIVKVLLHFGKQIPVIFIYPLQKIGVQIRNQLGMDSKMGPYYDPTSSNVETHKRITLLLEKISEDNKIILQEIFGEHRLEELSEKEANEILLRASPPDVYSIGLSRHTDSVRKILVYPPPPEKGGITLNNQDYACLGEDQFLNDVIIDFYLKYLMQRILSPEDRNRTHVFSTFFYKRLTTKPKSTRKNDPENDPKLSPAEKRHMRVKGWTKQVNLFEKDFIIVPINEHSHWFLAIICFPGLTGPVRFSDNTPVEPEEVMLKKNVETVQIGNTTITHIIKSDGNTISLELECGSDRDEAEGDQDDLHPSSDDEESEQVDEGNPNVTQIQIPLLAPLPQTDNKESKSKPVKRKIFKEPIKQPCILIFDSLAGASRVRVVATLRDYLKIEYKAKMGKDRDFSKDTIKGAVPKVPQQNNFTDCGLYVLQYVESFFQDPLHDFKLPLKYLQEWFPEEVVSCKRQKLAMLIRSLMEEQEINVEEMALPVLTFTNGNSTEENQVPMEEEDEEENEEEANDDEEEELNEEEEDLITHRVHIAEIRNEDEEDMDVAADEEDEEEEEEDVDEVEEEELEVGEIPKHWLSRGKGTCNESESPVDKGECSLITCNSLVSYADSESDEEEMEEEEDEEEEDGEFGKMQSCESPLLNSSVETAENQLSEPLKQSSAVREANDCDSEYKDGEDNGGELDMVISEDEDGDQVSAGETSFDDQNLEKVNANPGEVPNSAVSEEKISLGKLKKIVSFENKAVEVTDILRKLMCDKNITISRKEEGRNVNIFKKPNESRQILKAKDCDRRPEEEEKSEEIKREMAMGTSTSPASAFGNKNNSQKRGFQSLKSVRIPKKTERTCSDVSESKRQKVNEI